MNLILSRSALSEIQRECLSYPFVESGGILVGRCDQLEIVVSFVIGSGPDSRRSFTRFEPDVEWQQKLLDEYFHDFGLNYVGSFHRHFCNFSRPSSVDYRTAMQILADPDWAVSEIVFPIILPRGDAIEIYPYFICRENPQFELIPLGVVPDDDPSMTSTIQEIGKMSRIVILKDLAGRVEKGLSENSDPIPIYGRSYPDEELLQLWSLESRRDLEEVARAIKCEQESYLLFSGKKRPWHEIEVILYMSDYTSRAEGIIDTDVLFRQLVSLVGLGSVGSELALYLAQASVGQFRLIDMDTLSASNVSRHACDINHLGRYKTRAAKDLILSRNPQVQVETFEEDFLELSFENQVERLKGSDLVIASTDSTECQFVVNEVCIHLRIPALYVGCYELAQAGEVIFVIPGKTPCLNCLLEFRSKGLAEIKKKERRIPYSNEDPGGLKAEPGLAIDITFPTVVAAAHALALLNTNSKRGALLNPEKNLILLHAGSPPQGSYAEIFKAPFDYLLGKGRKTDQCEVCHTSDFSEVSKNADRTDIS